MSVSAPTVKAWFSWAQKWLKWREKKLTIFLFIAFSRVYLEIYSLCCCWCCTISSNAYFNVCTSPITTLKCLMNVENVNWINLENEVNQGLVSLRSLECCRRFQSNWQDSWNRSHLGKKLSMIRSLKGRDVPLRTGAELGVGPRSGLSTRNDRT